MIKLITIFILLPVILLSQKFNKFRVGDNHYKISNIEYLSLGGQHNDIIVNIYVDSLPNNIKTKYIHSICKLNKYESIVFDYIANKPIKASFGTYFIYINNISSKLCNIMKLNYNDNL